MELRDYLRVFRAHWRGMVLISLAAVLLAFGWVMLQPKIYTADASAIVQVDQGGDDAGSVMVGDSIASSRVKTYVDLGTSRSVAERVIKSLGLDTSPQALVGDVTVINPLDTVLLRVSASASSPEMARDIAEAWVRGMGNEVNRLETGDPEKQGGVFLKPIDSARLPVSPSSPNVRLSLAVGLLGGLVVAVAYSLLRYTLDRRIRSVEGVEKETGIAVVGTIPLEKTFTAENRLVPYDGGTSLASTNGHLAAIGESIRELRTNIQFMDVDNPPRIMVISSPLPGDGKSTISSNLAVTLASGGERVILLDGDLRRPMVHTIFGLPKGAGLSDVLAGRAEFGQVAQRIPGMPNLLVVGAGKIPPNPSEVLGSARMRELLQSLAKEAIVIVDAPPLIPVTDAAVVANSADGAIVVATVGKTTYEILAKALSNLERAGARPLGVVLNRVPRKGSGAAYYGYQYHGNYYRPDGEAEGPTGVAPPPIPPQRVPAPVGAGPRRQA